jgi:DNA-binding NarL/FixJ family response regulator
MTTRVVIADDQDLVRDGLKAVLETDPRLKVVGEASDGAETVRVVARTSPDVALIDIRMPILDGIEATRRILTQREPPRVLILTTFDLDEYVLAALQVGASGFLLKDAPRDSILEAVHKIAAGDFVLARPVTRRLIEHYVRTQPATVRDDRIDLLTDRETSVLTLLARGLTNAEIAQALFIGESTVKSYVANIFSKLGARDRVQATIMAFNSGLVSPPNLNSWKPTC